MSWCLALLLLAKSRRKMLFGKEKYECVDPNLFMFLTPCILKEC